MSVIKEQIRTARKHHDCEACIWLFHRCDTLEGYSFAEKRAIAMAKRNNWKIVPGQQYLIQAIAYDGCLRTFKAIPAIHKICIKYEIYEYD